MNKKILTAVALASVMLTAACSSGTAAPQSQPAPASQASEITPSPSSTKAVPDVIGLTVEQAVPAIEQWGFETTVEYDMPSDVPKKEQEDLKPDFIIDDQNEFSPVVGGKPNVLLEASPGEEFNNKYRAFEFRCRHGGIAYGGASGEYYSYQDVWASENFKEYTDCYVEPQTENWEPTKEQKKVAAIANKHWDGDEEPVEAYAMALQMCALPVDKEGDKWASTPKPWLKAAVALCPDAPFHKEMKAWADGDRFGSGEHQVGEDIAAGTYRSNKKVRDCYWERLTPNGGIIANDFVSYAAAGASVTVRKGETFSATEACGLWAKQ